MKKQIMCIILVLSLIFIFAAPVCAEDDWTGYTPISTPEELDQIRQDLGGKYYLTNDIVFTPEDFEQDGTFYNDGEGWLPIGGDRDPFCGILDGNGYAIRGLQIDICYPDYNYYTYGFPVGLIATNNGIIRNLDIYDSDIRVTSSSDGDILYAGAFCGENYGIITHCRHDGNIYSDYDAGGIAGRNYRIITNCMNEGTVTSAKGYEFGGAGGIAAASYNNYIYDSNAYVEVQNQFPVISNCSNKAKIEGCANYNGGICGLAGSDIGGFGMPLVKNCYNLGDIEPTVEEFISLYSGGIIGEAYYYKNLKYYPVLENCYNSGMITSASADSYIGAIVGCTNIDSIPENAYYLDNLPDWCGSCYDDTGGNVEAPNDVTALNQSEMKDINSFEGFDFQNVWDLNSDVASPVLRSFQPAVEVTEINLYPKTKGICVGSQAAILYEAFPVNHNNKDLIWSTSDSNVATVSETGIVTGIGEGTAVISLSSADGNCCGEMTITVFQKAAVVNFNDVLYHEWYYPYVNYVSKLGLFNGVGNNLFAPNSTMTRAMVVTVLYRMDSEPEASDDHPFTDVETGTWYTDAVAWAYENKIVNGMTETIFAPNNNITREQFTTILYRYAKYKNMETDNHADLGDFPDSNLVFDYAVDAFSWAYDQGIINGKATANGNFLAPQEKTTRAEVSKMISKLITEQLHMGDACDVKFWQDSYTLEEGSSLNLSCMVCPDNALEEIIWESGDTSIVTVNNGVITGIKPGSTYLHITLPNGVYDTCRVNVTKKTSRFEIAFNTLKNFVIENGKYTAMHNQYYYTFPDSQNPYGCWAIDYDVDNDSILLSYITEEDYSSYEALDVCVSINIFNEGDPYVTVTSIDVYSYGSWSDIDGYVTFDPKTYTKNSKIYFSEYYGKSELQSDVLDITKSYMNYTLVGMEAIFKWYGFGISIRDFGFTAFEL